MVSDVLKGEKGEATGRVVGQGWHAKRAVFSYSFPLFSEINRSLYLIHLNF